MIKSQLIKRISKKIPRLPERVIGICISRIIDVMNEALAQGWRIEIRNFGGFSLRFRASHNAHNPKTGAKVLTLPMYILRFKPGKELRKRVNAGKDKPIIISSDVEDRG